MKKRIISILLALFITAYSIVNCSLVPVLATPVITTEVLFNGLMTLLFSLGVTLDITNLTKDTANDIMQNYIEDSIGDDQNLIDQYQEFLDNLEYGYIVLGSNLYYKLKDVIFDDYIKPQSITGSIDPRFKDFIGLYDGYYYYFNNFRNSIGYALYIVTSDNVIDYYPPNIINDYGNYYSVYFANVIDTRIYSYEFFNNNLGVQESVYTRSGDLETYIFDKAIESDLVYYDYLGYIGSDFVLDDNLDSVILTSDDNEYDLLLDGVWLDNGDFITTFDGDIPQVIDGDTISDIAGDVKAGNLTWEQAIGDIIGSYDDTISPDLPLTPSKLDSLINGLNIERVLTKFPFCIPADLKLIIDGATTVSSNAPIIDIPLHLEYAGTVYYDNDHAIVIDFSDFESVVIIFREGFFLLFLVGLVWLTIDILQAFFVVTE